MIKQPGAILRGLVVGVFCGLVASASWAGNPPPQNFDRLLAQGYGELADAAAQKLGSDARTAYFRHRKALAARRRDVAPQIVEGRALDAFTLREAGFARGQLVEKLEAGARQHQPLLAAVAQVNFDCWIAPRSSPMEEAESSECRRRFYFAFAGLKPATAVEIQSIAQVEPASLPPPTPSISGNSEPREQVDPGAIQRAYDATLHRQPSRRPTAAAPPSDRAPASLASAIAVFEQAIADANAARRAYLGTFPQEPRLSQPNSAPPFYEYGPPPGSR